MPTTMVGGPCQPDLLQRHGPRRGLITIGSQPVTSWRINGMSSWYATQPMNILDQ